MNTMDLFPEFLNSRSFLTVSTLMRIKKLDLRDTDRPSIVETLFVERSPRS